MPTANTLTHEDVVDAVKTLTARINKLTIGEATNIPYALGAGFVVRVANDGYVVQQDYVDTLITGGKRASGAFGTGRVQLAKERTIEHLLSKLKG